MPHSELPEVLQLRESSTDPLRAPVDMTTKPGTGQRARNMNQDLDIPGPFALGTLTAGSMFIDPISSPS
jgi:hypothetical protein